MKMPYLVTADRTCTRHHRQTDSCPQRMKYDENGNNRHHDCYTCSWNRRTDVADCRKHSNMMRNSDSMMCQHTPNSPLQVSCFTMPRCIYQITSNSNMILCLSMVKSLNCGTKTLAVAVGKNVQQCRHSCGRLYQLTLFVLSVNCHQQLGHNQPVYMLLHTSVAQIDTAFGNADLALNKLIRETT